ncbi:MAG: hypothetical protein AAGA11_15160 [Pseudomonadota bacterium]
MSLSLVIAGCATVPSNTAVQRSLFTDASPVTVRPEVDRLIDVARAAVERRLRVDLAHVDVHVVDKDTMADWHRRSVTRGFLSQFDQRHLDRLADDFVEERLDSVLAFYDETDKVIVYDAVNVANYVASLAEAGVSERDALLPLFIHEWVHAADDVRVDFSGLQAQYGGNNLAFSAVFEGHAELLAKTLCRQLDCEHGFAVAASSFRHRNRGYATLDVLPGRSGNSSTLRYLEGRRYLERMVRMPEGQALVEATLRQPPRDAVSIFAADPRPDTHREQQNQALQSALSRFEFPLKTGDWVQFAGNPVDANAFPTNATRREQVVSSRLRIVEGAAETVFYEQSGDRLDPVELRVTRTTSAETAQHFAAEAASAFRRQSGSVVGASLSLRNLRAEQTEMSTARHGVDGVMYEVSAHLYQRGERVGVLNFTATASADYVFEVVSGVPVGMHAAAVRAGRAFLRDLVDGAA